MIKDKWGKNLSRLFVFSIFYHKIYLDNIVKKQTNNNKNITSSKKQTHSTLHSTKYFVQKKQNKSI